MVAIGTLTTSMVEVTQRIIDILELHKDDFGVSAVYYGLQDLIPTYPAITIESGIKSRELDARRGGGTHRFGMYLSTRILIEHGAIQSTTVTKKESEQLAELVEAKLHEDLTLGGLVIFGMVTNVDPGIVRRGDVMIRATRLLWEGTSREEF